MKIGICADAYRGPQGHGHQIWSGRVGSGRAGGLANAMLLGGQRTEFYMNTFCLIRRTPLVSAFSYRPKATPFLRR